jgi:hypothetical protein
MYYFIFSNASREMHFCIIFLKIFLLLSTHVQLFASDLSTEKQNYDKFHFRDRYVNVVQKIAENLTKTIIIDGKYFRFDCIQPNFKLKEMNPSYLNESIEYFTEQGLEKRQVYLVNGIIYNTNLSPYNSKIALDELSGNGEMIVLDQLGNTFISPKERGIHHHSSFFSGGSLAFAGLVYVVNGKMEKLIAYSGHYSTGEMELSSIKTQLDTIYLIEEPILPSLKFDSKGNLLQTVVISSSHKISELYNLISELGSLFRPRLRLIGGGKCIAEAKYRESTKNWIDITIAESGLTSGLLIWAIEFRCTTIHRVWPVKKFELIVKD